MKMTLCSGKHSKYFIVVSRDADEVTKYAAEELEKYIYLATDAIVPYHSDLCDRRGPEIFVGRGARGGIHDRPAGFLSLGAEGCEIKTEGEDILIRGDTSRGTLYGVYEFLERFLGIRWFAADEIRIPRSDTVDIEIKNENGEACDSITVIPAFECRDVYWRGAFDGYFASHNRINSGKADISPKQGGMERFYNFHHAMLDLVPPDEYFGSHPEYFSEIDGKRIKNGQLCLSNPDVLEISVERVKKWIKDNPSCRIFSVAQNDNQRYCRCEKCRTLDEKEGSPSANVIAFTNKLAERIAAEYPDIYLHTFAYQYTRKPPKTLCAHKNVIIRLCNIECALSKPLEYYIKADPCSTEARFVNDLKGWSEKCKHLYIWDYCTNFSHYLMPFPNLDGLAQNIRLFYETGVRGLFEEGNFSQGGGGSMAPLQAYLQARLMINPYEDIYALTDEFLNGYFGKSAPYIREYLDLMQNAVKPFDMRIRDCPNAGWLESDMIEKAQLCFDMAKSAAENEKVFLRVEKEWLSILYVRLTRMELGAPGRDEMIDMFEHLCRKHHITELHERLDLDFSIEVMKKSRYAADRSGMYVLYYRM
ncbi:MAG: DUF4838 domain-containing protein [Oscillospiraceae bacterium]|nr:DUF4838 domain-containing protein [Oscillospiraceae bacterium]